MDSPQAGEEQQEEHPLRLVSCGEAFGEALGAKEEAGDSGAAGDGGGVLLPPPPSMGLRRALTQHVVSRWCKLEG